MLLQFIFGLAMLLFALFLILLVLVQRGRGGGLAGALGGAGGESAFGSRAGDQFTWITYIGVSLWILVCIVSIAVLNKPNFPKKLDEGTGTTISGADAAETTDATEEDGANEDAADTDAAAADGESTDGTSATDDSEEPTDGASIAPPPVSDSSEATDGDFSPSENDE